MEVYVGKLEKAIELKAQAELLLNEAKAEMIAEYKELKGKIELVEKKYLKQFNVPISNAKEAKVKVAKVKTTKVAKALKAVSGAKRGRKPKVEAVSEPVATTVELTTKVEPKKRGRKAKIEVTPESSES
jgi:hypothetical protein